MQANRRTSKIVLLRLASFASKNQFGQVGQVGQVATACWEAITSPLPLCVLGSCSLVMHSAFSELLWHKEKMVLGQGGTKVCRFSFTIEPGFSSRYPWFPFGWQQVSFSLKPREWGERGGRQAIQLQIWLVDANIKNLTCQPDNTKESTLRCNMLKVL